MAAFDRFLALHRPGTPLLLPNPWDVGSARLLASRGFEALATTSGGFAATLGRLDGSVSREEANAHSAAIVSATDLPVSADLENGFADDTSSVAETVRLAVEVGLAGCSIEDSSGQTADASIYDVGLAAERVAAAAEAAHAGPEQLVLTARAENYLHGRRDLDDTIARLVAYQEAGADVLYAPGVADPGELRALVSSVDKPVNVLALPTCPPVAELAEMGVARISVGGAFAYAALGAVVEAARELREDGTYGFWSLAGAGGKAVRAAFTACAGSALRRNDRVELRNGGKASDGDRVPAIPSPFDAHGIACVAEDPLDVGGDVAEEVPGIRVVPAVGAHSVRDPAAVGVDEPRQQLEGMGIGERLLPRHESNGALMLPATPVLGKQAKPMPEVCVELGAPRGLRPADWAALAHG